MHYTYFRHADVGECFKEKEALLSSAVPQLSLVDAGGSHRGHAHAIANKEDDILGPSDHRLMTESLLQLLVGEVCPVNRVWCVHSTNI